MLHTRWDPKWPGLTAVTSAVVIAVAAVLACNYIKSYRRCIHVILCCLFCSLLKWIFQAWITLGRAQLNFGEPDSAIESFDRALAIKVTFKKYGPFGTWKSFLVFMHCLLNSHVFMHRFIHKMCNSCVLRE